MLRQDRQRSIYKLWDDLADFGAGQVDRALFYLMNALAEELGADDIIWVGALRVVRGRLAHKDPLKGWRVRVFEHLTAPPEIEQRSAEAMREQDQEVALTTRALALSAGRFRVYRLRDGFIDFAAFRKTLHYRKFYQEPGIRDRLWVAFPTMADAESVFVVDRYHSRQRFTENDAAYAGALLRGLKWFHRQLFLSHGLHLVDTPIPPSQRRVLNALLSDMSEKQIAAQLGLSPGTTHQYAVEIYRRFGVNGRAGLMALWLGG